MPFALVFIGMVLVVTGLRDTYKQAGTLIVGDLTGKSGGAGFIMFIAAFGMLGALGAVGPKWRTFSHYFMALIIVALVLHNSNFMQKLIAALKGARATTPVSATPGGQSSIFNMFGAPSSGSIGSAASNTGYSIGITLPGSGQTTTQSVVPGS
jgi:hypothetical protein